MTKNLDEAVAAYKTARLDADRATEEAAAAAKAAAEKKAAKDTAITAMEDAKRAVDHLVERMSAPPSKGIV
jgi:hypothetical protein